jgi:hypothetical protein
MIEAITRRAAGFRPKVAVLLGSGLGGFAEDVKAIATIPYAELPDFPQTSVSSHAGQLVLGHVGPTPGRPQADRTYYESGRADEMAGAIRAMAEPGCEILFHQCCRQPAARHAAGFAMAISTTSISPGQSAVRCTTAASSTWWTPTIPGW